MGLAGSSRGIVESGRGSHPLAKQVARFQGSGLQGPGEVDKRLHGDEIAVK
jgi:hypothetical protein